MLRRVIDDPIASRRWGWRALAVPLALLALGQLLDDGFLVGMMTAIAWIIAPLIALAIGYGEAFFLQYGASRRRITLMVALGTLLAIASCVVLSGVVNEADRAGQWVNMVGTLVLYGAVVVGLSGLVAIGIGRGSSYVSRKIDIMSRDDW